MRRRARGEGCIRQRKDGRWEARSRGHSIYAKTEREVVEALRRELGDEQPRRVDRSTLKAFLATWLDHMHGKIRPNTHATYSLYVRLHITPHIGKIKLAKLTPLDVQQMLDTVAKDHAPGTVRHARTVLKMALQKAVEWELVRRNVAAAVRPPKRSPGTVQPFTEDELRAYLVALRDEPYDALWHLAVTVGMRLGELLGLRWGDIDLDAALLHVERTRQPLRLGGEMAPKTSESRRAIRLPVSAVAVLRAYRVRQLEWRMAAPAWIETDRVFTTRHGSDIDHRNVDRWYKRLLKRAKITTPHRFHDTRHTCATIMLDRGVPVKQVSEILGHSGPGTTLAIYAHTMRGAERRGADVMDELTKA